MKMSDVMYICKPEKNIPSNLFKHGDRILLLTAAHWN